jgi:hypothetical protein
VKALVYTILILAVLPILAWQPPKTVSEELQTVERTLAELQSLKNDLQATEARVDALIALWSERKGQLQNTHPPAFGGSGPYSSEADRPDVKPATVRCAALTKDGTRCTRPAVPGQRYCKQHLLARQK